MKNKFVYLALFVTIIACLIFIYKDDLSTSFTPLNLSNSNNTYELITEGTNDINVVGSIEYNGETYKYLGSFKESFLNISLYQSTEVDVAVKKVSSGLIAFDYNEKPVSIRIDYEDTFDENKKKYNHRSYTINVEYDTIKKEINKEVDYKGIQRNPLYQLDLVKILKESGVFQ